MAELYDHDAERYLLGAVMLNGDRFGEAAELVDESMFHKGAHRTVWESVVRLHGSDSGRCDSVAVADDLEAHGQLQGVGGFVALSDMLSATPTSTTAVRDATRVRELARRRRVQRAASELAHLAGDLTSDLDAQLLTSVDKLTATTDDRRGLIRVADVAEEVWRLRTEGRTSEAVSTGWRALDQVWRPAPGKLTVVTGHPGHGKSAVLDALAVNLASQHKWRTAFWSIEQAPVEEHLARLSGIAGNVQFDDMPYEMLDKFVGYKDKPGELDRFFTWVDHDVHTTVPAILSQFRIADQRHKVDMAIIDPWTDVELPRERGVRQDEAIIEGLVKCFRFARATRIHVVVVVHPKQRDRKPDGTLPVVTNADLHGGSAYYKVCDSLLSVWRDEQSINRESTVADVYVQKVRRDGIDGRVGGVAQMVMNPKTGVYRPLMQAVM